MRSLADAVAEGIRLRDDDRLAVKALQQHNYATREAYRLRFAGSVNCEAVLDAITQAVRRKAPVLEIEYKDLSTYFGYDPEFWDGVVAEGAGQALSGRVPGIRVKIRGWGGPACLVVSW